MKEVVSLTNASLKTISKLQNEATIKYFISGVIYICGLMGLAKHAMTIGWADATQERVDSLKDDIESGYQFKKETYKKLYEMSEEEEHND